MLCNFRQFTYLAERESAFPGHITGTRKQARSAFGAPRKSGTSTGLVRALHQSRPLTNRNQISLPSRPQSSPRETSIEYVPAEQVSQRSRQRPCSLTIVIFMRETPAPEATLASRPSFRLCV